MLQSGKMALKVTSPLSRLRLKPTRTGLGALRTCNSSCNPPTSDGRDPSPDASIVDDDDACLALLALRVVGIANCAVNGLGQNQP